jgi:subtilisin family serine protease
MSAPDFKRRIHPKLRVMLNSEPAVNAARAELQGCLAVAPKLARARLPLSSVAMQASAALKASDVAPGKIDAADPNRRSVLVNVFVQTSDANAPALKGERAGEANMRVLRVPLDDVEALSQDGDVAFVEPAENLKAPGALRLSTRASPPRSRAARITDADKHEDGTNVLIGIIDVEGFDWLHPDFEGRDGKTRFISIWDQGRRDGAPPANFEKEGGVEITQAAMEAARKAAKKIKVSPHDIERQSEMYPGSHGTHVASIAAGNRGLCPFADIAAVLVALPESEKPDDERRTSFYDSSNLLAAVRYLIDLADLRKQPISINISLGTNGHAHDGSSVLDRWIDQLIAKPGRAICVAAGNAGQEREDKPGDLGYVLGRIHTSGQIAARGLYRDIDWVVAGDSVIDVSENELEFWYEPQDRFSISIKPPNHDAWIGPVAPGECIENLQLPDKSLLSIYNELYHPANGCNYISAYLTPFMKNDVVIGVASGVWTVRLHGLDIRDGRFHGWIERDDPMQLEDGKYFWPSYFSERSNVDSFSVSSLACGTRVISVANLDEVRQRINLSSSQGPTRDGRQKPDIAARGTAVLAANGFGQKDEPWIEMTGTSMASPYVAGVVGLMLAARPELTAAQINGILKATAKPLPGGSYAWVNDCGFGVIDPDECVVHAQTAHLRSDIKDKFK